MQCTCGWCSSPQSWMSCILPDISGQIPHRSHWAATPRARICSKTPGVGFLPPMLCMQIEKHKAIHFNLQFPRMRVWTWMCGHEMRLKLDLPNLQLSSISQHPWEWSPGLELLPAESWAVSLSEGSAVLFSYGLCESHSYMSCFITVISLHIEGRKKN